jgi:SNF2 family DNA or RNA helicase
MLESFHQKENQRFEGKVYHAPELDSMIAESKYYNAKVSDSFRDFMGEAQNGKPVEAVVIPADMGAVLRHYQKEGIDWFYFLRKYRFGGILADDMGLGKTLQALLLISMNKEAGKPTLVVCPKTLLFNWQDEALKFFPDMKTVLVEGNPKERGAKIKNAKEYDLVITSFSALKKDADVYEKMKLRFNYCIIDEAQFIKNHNTQSAKAVKKIDADYRLAMTGTPLENSISEIWSIFDFIMPGFLGSYSAFKSRFESPIMKQSDAEALAALRAKIACFMLRRSKSAVLKELPPKIEQIAHCQLGDHQNILYQEILANTKKEITAVVKTKGFAKSQIHILAALMKLRQVCNHPALLLKDLDYEKYESAKLDLFMELLDEIMASGRKVLVFSQFTSMLDILAKEMKEKKIKYNYLSGKTQNRKELVDDFNTDPDKKVFLISLKAGGTGLNLVSADNVIIFDPWWNPSVENQAIDRAHRIGQTNSVNVYKLVTRGTIEEKILKLQEKKKFLFDNLVDESNELFKKLTWDEVRELFD